MIVGKYQVTLAANPETIVGCAALLVERVQDLQIKIQSDKSQQIYINKCWNILRSIAENTCYIPKLLEQLEAVLLPLLALIAEPESIEFEDDIVLLLTSFIKGSRRVTINQLQLFPCFLKVFQKESQIFAQLFFLFN